MTSYIFFLNKQPKLKAENVKENNVLSEVLSEVSFLPLNTIKIVLYKNGENTNMSEILTVIQSLNETSNLNSDTQCFDCLFALLPFHRIGPWAASV